MCLNAYNGRVLKNYPKKGFITVVSPYIRLYCLNPGKNNEFVLFAHRYIAGDSRVLKF